MLKEFLYFNKATIKSYAAIYGIGWGLLMLFIFVVVHDGLHLPLYHVILLYFAIVIGIIAFLLLLTILGGLYDFIRRRSAFQQDNWREFFAHHKFETIPVRRQKYSFAEEAKYGLIGSIPVLAEISPVNKKFIKLNFFAISDSISKELVEHFKTYNAQPEGEYFYKLLRKDKKMPCDQIEKEVIEFAHVLINNGFVPIEQ